MSEGRKDCSQEGSLLYSDEAIELALARLKLSGLKASLLIIIVANAALVFSLHENQFTLLLFAIPAEACVLGNFLSISMQIHDREFYAKQPSLWLRFRICVMMLLKKPSWGRRKPKKKFHSHRKRT